jgi:hypothetical protein
MDRPFNLQGEGYGYLFRSEFVFRTTRELELFFLSRKARIFFPQSNIIVYCDTHSLNRLLGNDHLKKYSDFSGGKKNNMIQSFCHIT